MKQQRQKPMETSFRLVFKASHIQNPNNFHREGQDSKQYTRKVKEESHAHLAVKNKFTGKCYSWYSKPCEDMEVDSYNAAAHPTFHSNINLALSKVIESLNNSNTFIYAKSRHVMGMHGSRFPCQSCQSLFNLVLEEPLLVTTVI